MGDNRSQFSRQTLPTTVCCQCGVPIVANSVNTCARCLQSRHDITDVLEKQIVIVQCKRCEKWQKEDATYTRCDMESKELLAFCLRKMHNLRTLKLVDASFLWTEPHSKRIKVKLKLQKEVERSVILQQTCVIEFIVQNKMCLDCHRSEASLTWESVVQVRQVVDHKRTFLYLEQLILKHRAQDRAVKIEPQPEGVDFFFYSKTDGARFVSFLDTMVPIKFKMSEKLITADLKSNNATYTFSYSVEIAPICKDDLIILPKNVANQLGSMPRVCVCLNVASVIRLIDPFSGRFCELAGNTYWLNPFRSILSAKRLVLFMVLDVLDVDEEITVMEPEEDEEEDQEQEDGAEAGSMVSYNQQKKRRRKAKARKFSVSARLSSKHRMCEVVVAKESDLGRNDKQYVIKSHLGYVLKPGDYALGYDVTTCNMNHDENDHVDLPEIVLVKKHYVRNDKMERNWKLKSITREAPNAPGLGVGVRSTTGGDMEMFMRDLEEDAEMRSKVNVFKRKSASKKRVEEVNEDEDDEHDAPEIPQHEMLDDAQRTDAEENAEDEEEESDDDL